MHEPILDANGDRSYVSGLDPMLTDTKNKTHVSESILDANGGYVSGLNPMLMEIKNKIHVSE